MMSLRSIHSESTRHFTPESNWQRTDLAPGRRRRRRRHSPLAISFSSHCCLPPPATRSARRDRSSEALLRRQDAATATVSGGGMAAPPASSHGGGVDRLSPLPEEVLAQILSFLPAQVAARTCVLARSWRDVWKLTRRLRITGTAKPESVYEVRRFVDHLLGLRLREIQRAPLDACEITFRDYYNGNDEEVVQRWISHAVQCQVQTLQVDMLGELGPLIFVSKKPLVSSHLTRLVLCCVIFSNSFSDFSSCPVLKGLELDDCDLSWTERMRSPSLKRLSIIHCYFKEYLRFRISVPSLVWLRLDCPSFGKAPVLESTPELVVAYINIHPYREYGYLVGLDVIGAGCSSDDDDEEGSVDIAGEYSGKCVLLGGLSEAMDLTLLCDSIKCYLFQWDLRWCPTFWKLKTLVLNDYWCEPADCRTLACILEHAPVLEQLSVVFTSGVQHKYKVEMEGRLDATEESTLISQHLKTVKVKCDKIDKRVLNVLDFLGTLNICFSSDEWDEGSE